MSPWRQPVKDGLIQGTVQAVVLVLILYLAVAIVGNDEQATLNEIRDANQGFVAGVLCGLGAPTRQIEQPDGTVQTIRPERFLNRVCLESRGFKAVDLNGDGVIEGGRP